MITKWKVANFKSIREETELDLSPLTIFAGANSSGKSTFIQSILLVAQTLANKVSSRSVVLNGALTSLGQFDDLMSTNSESDQITIKWTCCPLADQDGFRTRSAYSLRGLYYSPRFGSLREITCEISFDADSLDAGKEFLQIQPRLFGTQLVCTVRDEENLDQKAEIAIRQKSLSDSEGLDLVEDIDDQLRNGLAYKVDIDSGSLAEIYDEFRSAKPIGCVLRHFLPERIIYSIDTIQEDANTIALALQDESHRMIELRLRRSGRRIRLSEEVVTVLRSIIKDVVDFDKVFKNTNQQEALIEPNKDSITLEEWFERLLVTTSGERLKIQQALSGCENLYDLVYEAMARATPPSQTKQRVIQHAPPNQISRAAMYMDDFWASSLKYLGPLRDAPKPLYPLAPAADPYDVGIRGEHTASILDLHKNKKIVYFPSANFNSPGIERKTITRTLEVAVTDWLQYLGVANTVSSQDKGKLGHELKVGLPNSDSTHDLTHVGVGVSQVLPILVMCLLANTDSTLVFEQPELHLHPKVQTLLGDFFLSMALCNKQCIVETHSEYLIDRLRSRIAASTSENELNSLAKIYFVEKPSLGSLFREVVINEYGAILDWPEGFFDQSQQQAENILSAALAKKRAQKNKE